VEYIKFEDVYRRLKIYNGGERPIKETLPVYYFIGRGQYQWANLPRQTRVTPTGLIEPRTFLLPPTSMMYVYKGERITPAEYRAMMAEIRKKRGKEEEERQRRATREIHVATAAPYRHVHKDDPMLAFLTGEWVYSAYGVEVDDARGIMQGAAEVEYDGTKVGQVRVLDLWHSLEPESFEILEKFFKKYGILLDNHQ
jgi:hypothetical protein